MADPRDDDDLAPPAGDHDATLISTSPAEEGSAKRVATLVVLRGPAIGSRHPLRRNRVVVGRGENADVLIAGKEISRAHASIETLRMGGETLYRITDLGSTNHVFVNGEQVAATLLADGDKLQMGDVLVSFELHDALDERFHDEVRKRIEYDDLTGLLTYQSFRTALEWELRRSRSPKGCAIVMMDLDDFKKLNDTYGHLAGSFVLREVGAVIRGNLRPFDVGSRYGGEEFVAYLPETDAAEAMTAAERLRRVLAERVFLHQERAIRLTISMGISHFPDHGDALEPLVQVADERLYVAKRTGKNRVIGA